MMHPPSSRGLDAILDELRPALRSGIADLAESLLGAPNKGLSSRAEWRWGNKGSFRVKITGHDRGACADFESDWKGDPLALIQRVRGCDFNDAVLWGAGWAGIDTEGREAKPEDPGAKRAREAARELKRIEDEARSEADRKRRMGAAQRLWQHRADTAIDTVAERYAVLTRGIPINPTAWPDAVGFLPSNGPLVWHEEGPDGEEIRREADCAGALILAATLPDGTVSAVQRIFLTDEADNIRRSNGTKIKLTTGAIAGLGAAVRLPGPADGPVLIAEGPETGLSLWAATGYETHIAIGSLSGAMPPPGRHVVICRDDDRPNSPADKALGRLLADWRRRGVRLAVATPWRTRRGDKSDFNDVIRSEGATAVRERVAITINPGAPPPKRVPAAEARRILDEAVARLFLAVTEWKARVEQAERDAKANLDALIWERLPDEAKAWTLARSSAAAARVSARAAREIAKAALPGEARKVAQVKARAMEAEAAQARQRASEAAREAKPLRKEIDRIKRRARKNVEDAMQALIAAPPVHAIRVDTGLGKSHAARRAAALQLRQMRAAGDQHTVAFAVPTHALGAEQVALFSALPEAAGLRAAVWRGREASDPEQPAQAMCRDLAAVDDARAAMADVQSAVCRRVVDGKAIECPHFSACGYQRQRGVKADLWFIPHELLFSAKPAAVGEPALVVVDESVWQAGLIEARDIALDALAQDDAVAGDDLASERLRFLRHRFLDAIRDLPDGPLPWSAVDAADITPATAGEAKTLEWRRRVEPAIYPGMPAAARKEAARAAVANKTIRRLARMWDALKALTQPDGPPASGWAALATAEAKEGPVRVIRLKGRRELGKGWAGLPTLVLDATLDPVLLRPYWPAIELTADVRAEAPHQHVRQVIDRTYSKAHMDQGTALRDVHAVICREARRYAPGRVLVIVQQAIEDALPGIGPLPVNAVLAHHNAVSGRDEWGAGPDRAGIMALIVVGRTMPSPAAAEQIAEALTGAAIERLPGWYPKTDTTREMASGAMDAAEADRHPHPVVEAVRWQIAEGELVQIIGRGRGVNRTEGDPIDVLAMVNAPLPMPVNEALSAPDLAPGPDDLMLAAGGVAFANPTDASAAYPSLWRTRNAAKLAFDRFQGSERLGTKSGQLGLFPNKELFIRKRPQLAEKCPQPPAGGAGVICKAEYQLAEARRSRSVAWYDPALVPDLEAWLTARLGPLAWCGIPPERMPRLNVVEAMAAAGIVLSNAGHAAAMFPNILPTRDAAKKAIGRALAGRRVLDLECAARLTYRASYQVAGAGNAPAKALVAPDRLATLRADLEAALGPLAAFDTTEAAADAGDPPQSIGQEGDAPPPAHGLFTNIHLSTNANLAVPEAPGGYGVALLPERQSSRPVISGPSLTATAACNRQSQNVTIDKGYKQ